MPAVFDVTNTMAGAPKGARSNFLSVLVAAGFAGLGALSFFAAHSVAGLLGAVAIGLLAAPAP